MDKMIERIRNELGLTQAAFAGKLGCSLSYYAKMAAGDRTPGPKFVRILWELCPAALLPELGYAVLEAAGVPVIDCYTLTVTPEAEEVE